MNMMEDFFTDESKERKKEIIKSLCVDLDLIDSIVLALEGCTQVLAKRRKHCTTLN